MTETSDRLRPLVVPTRRGAEQFRSILETLARVEMTDGLTFSQLVTEVADRLPADATVMAVLGDVPPDVAWTLGNLRRRGYAVTAVLVMFDEYESSECLGRLIAEGIDARLVTSEESLSRALSAAIGTLNCREPRHVRLATATDLGRLHGDRHQPGADHLAGWAAWRSFC